ncbi:hypothetical protein F4818DRAFT_282649 [Hypoxylon cercidicola]|nr:hypothetical protein F4818DRAFT_282649 [Hypoxylon cercidicola]
MPRELGASLTHPSLSLLTLIPTPTLTHASRLASHLASHISHWSSYISIRHLSKEYGTDTIKTIHTCCSHSVCNKLLLVISSGRSGVVSTVVLIPHLAFQTLVRAVVAAVFFLGGGWDVA